MAKLNDKIALVTGANSGIGLASARRFAEEGARVFLIGRRKPELDAAALDIGHGAIGISGDVSRMDDLDRIFEIIRNGPGHIDVLFANAGGGSFLALSDMTERHFDETFATNVKGTLFTVQKALPLLSEGASVILTGSTTATRGAPAFSVYGASKAAIRAFARHWAIEFGPRRIRVNVLVPGATSTPGLHGLTDSEAQNREFVAAMKAATPLSRMGEPNEIAAAALFLASDDSSYVNGSELFADGGSAQI